MAKRQRHTQNGQAQSSAIETWTPEKAKDQLTRNTRNRPISDPYILEIAQAIENNEWEINGETIKIASDEVLEDGQHRLEAIVLTGKSIDSWTVRGCPPHSFDTIDRGRKRTLSDVFARHGEGNYPQLASTLVLVWRFMHGTLLKGGPGSKPRAPQCQDFLDEHPEIRDSVRKCAGVRKVMSPPQASALHYLFSQKDAEAADVFFKDLLVGEGLRADDPVYVLREFLRDVRMPGSNRKLPASYIMAYAILAWNAQREGRKLKKLKWLPKQDEFPVIAD